MKISSVSYCFPFVSYCFTVSCWFPLFHEDSWRILFSNVWRVFFAGIWDIHFIIRHCVHRRSSLLPAWLRWGKGAATNKAPCGRPGLQWFIIHGCHVMGLLWDVLYDVLASLDDWCLPPSLVRPPWKWWKRLEKLRRNRRQMRAAGSWKSLGFRWRGLFGSKKSDTWLRFCSSPISS